MDSFTFDGLPGRVLFGADCVEGLAAEIDALQRSRVLLITTKGRVDLADRAGSALGAAHVGTFDSARPHVPFEQAEEVRALARDLGADCVLGIGGGTPVCLAKGVALTEPVSLVAVPTTYSGAEMTAQVGITRDGIKRPEQSPRLRPATVIYDPSLTLDLPARATATTGMNAIGHCVEALYAESPSPISRFAAEQGLDELVAGLPASIERPGDLGARTTALRGAYLAGLAVGLTGIALHHKVCHVLGATYDLGHGDANSVMLPYVARYNEKAAPEAMARVARALGADDPAAGLKAFAKRIGAPQSLAELGLDPGALDDIAGLTVKSVTTNPAAITAKKVRALLDAAYEGRAP